MEIQLGNKIWGENCAGDTILLTASWTLSSQYMMTIWSHNFCCHAGCQLLCKKVPGASITNDILNMFHCISDFRYGFTYWISNLRWNLLNISKVRQAPSYSILPRVHNLGPHFFHFSFMILLYWGLLLGLEKPATTSSTKAVVKSSLHPQ